MTEQNTHIQNIFRHKVDLKVLSIALATVLFTPFASAAELVVTSTSTSNFKAGQLIESSSEIALPKDATLTLMYESGKIITLTGPRSGPVQPDTSSNQSSGLFSSILKIFSDKKLKSQTLGAVRSVGGSKLPQDPWAIIANKTGRYCVTSTRAVVLWRANSSRTSNLVLINIDSDKEVKTVWHSGQNTLHWPRLLPLVDGATYRVDLSSETKLPKVSIKLVPNLPTPAHAAVWMNKNGCEKQALRLISSLK